MANFESIITQDLKHIWHPCSHAKDFEQYPPLVVSSAKGCYLETSKGKVFDAISSWWCKSLGHGHPAIVAAIQTQLQEFEHIIGANTTHPKLAKLGEKLGQISGNQHAFFASDGSSAVEIALKLALHAQKLQGNPEKTEFVALNNAYHGETLATLSVSDLGFYNAPYKNISLKCHFLNNIPYVSGLSDPKWLNCESEWELTLTQLEAVKNKVCAIIVEPILQGAAGMLCYSAQFLSNLAAWAKANNIYLIADEIMTGIGRTGRWLASEYANVKADLICLSKGLTSGSLPLSCVLVDHEIYQLFYGDYTENRSFLHSHTYTGNALAVSATLATLEIIEQENILSKVESLSICMLNYFSDIANKTGKLKNIRSLGAVVAGDLVNPDNKRLGFALQQAAIERGALIRPLGNTVYWLPPLIATEAEIAKLAQITLDSINAIY